MTMMRDRRQTRSTSFVQRKLETRGAPGKRTLTQMLPVQRREQSPDTVQHIANAGVAGANAALPHADTIQRAFGRHDVSHVRTASDGDGAAAAKAIGARAYATGDRVAFDGAPDLHTAAHEAAHVVQQRAGVQLAGGVGAAGDRYEQHADAVADAVASGRSAETLLDTMAGGGGRQGGGVQKEEATTPAPAAPAVSEDAQIVASLIANGVRNEVELTNAVFFHRHPELEGTLLGPDSAEAKEWIGIRDDLVRPALKAPAATAPATPGQADPAASGQTEQTETPSEEPGFFAGMFDAVTGFVTDVWNYLAGNTEVPIAEAPAGGIDGTTPAAPTEQAPAESIDTFRNQRDNEFVGTAGVGEGTSDKTTDKNKVHGDNTCNVTSLVMQLLTVTQDEAALRNAACELLLKHGGSVSDEDRATGQIEDLILRRFFLPEWASGAAWKPVSTAVAGYSTWADDVIAAGAKFHKYGVALNYVGGELRQWVGGIGETKHIAGKNGDYVDPSLLTPEYYEANFRKTLDAKGSIIMSTTLTDGHIVNLVSFDASGIVINDPFGMRLVPGAYLKHGSPLSQGLKFRDDHPDEFDRRTTVNPAAVTQIVEGGPSTMPTDLGERNFYNWAEVKTYAMGRWANTMEKAA